MTLPSGALLPLATGPLGGSATQTTNRSYGEPVLVQLPPGAPLSVVTNFLDTLAEIHTIAEGNASEGSGSNTEPLALAEVLATLRGAMRALRGASA